jgi:hypothetical protein
MVIKNTELSTGNYYLQQRNVQFKKALQIKLKMQFYYVVVVKRIMQNPCVFTFLLQ